MRDTDLIIRVEEGNIELSEPVPFDIFTAEGALIVGKGQHLSNADHLALVTGIGWHLVDQDQPVPAQAVHPAEAAKSVYPSDLRLPTKIRQPLHRASVLIADDTTLVRHLLRRMLRENNLLQIEEAEDGRRAISQFFRHRPHIVFLDIDMPGIDGLTALKRIKQWSPDTFVSMVSANSTLLNVQEAKEHGVDGFLVKPINALNVKRVLNLYQKTLPE